MKKYTLIGMTAVLVLAMLIGLFVSHHTQDWPTQFPHELDAFFGADNWSTLSTETKESEIFSTYYVSRDLPSLSGEKKGKFHCWDIGFTNRDGDMEAWTISDHTLRINNHKYGIFSPKRYTAKQALTQELMDISCMMAGDRLREELLQDILPMQELGCLRVEVSYRGGNPAPHMYDKLLAEPWFTANAVNAEDFLRTDLHDFYIDILAYDYRVEKLTEEEQQHLMDSLDTIEQALQTRFGDYTDYEIFLGKGYSAKFSGAKAKP